MLAWRTRSLVAAMEVGDVSLAVEARLARDEEGVRVGLGMERMGFGLVDAEEGYRKRSCNV
jgi:hypothetical protein